ncbi:hypothetical protein L6R52_36615, partial [Myxococcota bacterium]|nr:hypothetical protein [Myxococcota bacterium]
APVVLATALVALVALARVGLTRPARAGRRLALASALVTVAACSSSDGVPVKTFTTDGLAPATTYYWKVRARDAAGCARESEVRAFTTR